MLEAVKKKESERKYTPESEQHRFGNLQCIADLWRMDAADKVDDCWRSRLLPEGEIVTIGRGDSLVRRARVRQHSSALGR